MSFFSTTATLSHRTQLPQPITKEQAVKLMRNHDFLIRLDPELVSYTSNEPPNSLPVTSNETTKYYTVTDHMNALPKAIYDAKVSYDAELTEVEDGLRWVIRAPLGLIQTSHWQIKEDGGQLCLIEDVLVACSRLLMGTIKAKLEENWRGIHGEFIKKLLE